MNYNMEINANYLHVFCSGSNKCSQKWLESPISINDNELLINFSDIEIFSDDKYNIKKFNKIAEIRNNWCCTNCNIQKSYCEPTYTNQPESQPESQLTKNAKTAIRNNRINLNAIDIISNTVLIAEKAKIIAGSNVNNSNIITKSNEIINNVKNIIQDSNLSISRQDAEQIKQMAEEILNTATNNIENREKKITIINNAFEAKKIVLEIKNSLNLNSQIENFGNTLSLNIDDLNIDLNKSLEQADKAINIIQQNEDINNAESISENALNIANDIKNRISESNIINNELEPTTLLAIRIIESKETPLITIKHESKDNNILMIIIIISIVFLISGGGFIYYLFLKKK